jgi:hypothetical protein
VSAVVVLYMILSIPGRMPITHEQHMANAFDCLSEVNLLVAKFEAMRRIGQLQAGCVVIGAEKEVEH